MALCAQKNNNSFSDRILHPSPWPLQGLDANDFLSEKQPKRLWKNYETKNPFYFAREMGASTVTPFPWLSGTGLAWSFRSTALCSIAKRGPTSVAFFRIIRLHSDP